MINHDANPYEGTTAPPKSAYVQARRADGKYMVVFTFPISGRQIRKIMTAAQIDALVGYQIIGRYRL
jgi:hypothetical protein